ncbi:MAG: hypothetical protein ABSH41_00990 [Syntrophobacteraceae bacterium]|jgi:acyl-coenzyme A synthetase/AMP-(fatty) acid ligase
MFQITGPLIGNLGVNIYPEEIERVVKLDKYKVPRSVYFVDDVPKTCTGKIMRRKLADLLRPV